MSRTFDFILGLTVLAVSLGVIAWAFFFLLKRSYDPAKMLFKCAFTIPFVIFCVCFGIKMGLYGPILILIMGIILTIMWTPHIAEMVSKPLTDIFDGGNEPPEPKPYYSI